MNPIIKGFLLICRQLVFSHFFLFKYLSYVSNRNIVNPPRVSNTIMKIFHNFRNEITYAEVWRQQFNKFYIGNNLNYNYMMDPQMTQEQMMVSFNPDNYQHKAALRTNKPPSQPVATNIPQNSQKQIYHQVSARHNSVSMSSPPHINQQLNYSKHSSPPRVSYYTLPEGQNDLQKNHSPPVVFSYNQGNGERKMTNSMPKQAGSYGQGQIVVTPNQFANNNPTLIINSPLVGQAQPIIQHIPQPTQQVRPPQTAPQPISQQISQPKQAKQIQSQYSYQQAPQPPIDLSYSEQIIRSSPSSPQSINPIVTPQQPHQPISSNSQPTFYPHPNQVNAAPRAQTSSNNQGQSGQYAQQGQKVPQGYYQQNGSAAHQRMGPPSTGQNQQYANEDQQIHYGGQQYTQNDDLANQTSTLWQQRFNYLYQKYLMFYDKYDVITQQTATLNDHFLKVDSEDEWLALKERYDMQLERMNQVREQYALIIQEIQASLQESEKMDPSNLPTDEAGRVWEHRYHQLLQQYESLSHHYAELQSNEMTNGATDNNEQLAMMNQKYAQLQNEYNNVVEQLQNSPNSMQSRQEHEDLLKYTQQLQSYIEQLETENNNLMGGMKNSVENSKMIDQGEISQRLNERDNEINNLRNMVGSLEDKLKEADETQSRRKSNVVKDVHTSHLENQLQEIKAYCSEVEKKLAIKQYENNSLQDKIQFLEQQLRIKNEEAANNSRLLQERLMKIESEIWRKNNVAAPVAVPVVAPVVEIEESSFKLEEGYENKLKQYQKIISSKNNQIRVLEQRISESEAEKRNLHSEKMRFIKKTLEQNDNLQEEYRKKISERQAKIKSLEGTVKELEGVNQKSLQTKDNMLKSIEQQKNKIKEEAELRLMEREMTIKNLKEAIGRLQNELKERNNELSRVKNPKLRSLNASHMLQSVKNDEEVKQLNEQLQRKSEQLSKLRKQRDNKTYQYKTLETEFDSLQEQNNKRRMEINNLKRQLGNAQHLTYEVEDLRFTLSKRNQEINELKTALFELDKLKMESTAKIREVAKLNEISRLKNEQIEALKQRNYQLQEKLGRKDYKIVTDKIQFSAEKVSSNVEELLALQEQLRKKQIQLNRYKLENEELARVLKRDSEQLQSLKDKYPSKLKQIEEQSSELKIKIAALEKRSTIAQSKSKELEEINKKIKISLTEEYGSQNLRLKQYYVRFIDKQEEELKQSKEKNRKYEIELHDYELQMDRLNNLSKEEEIGLNEVQRKLKYVSDQLQKKQQQIKLLRSKQNGDNSVWRRKEERCIEVQALVKSKDYQMRDLEKKNELLKNNLKLLKKEYEDYKNSVIERMEDNMQQEMETINKEIEDYESKIAFQGYNFDFKVRDKKGNQVFERRVIYELKRQNERLQKELEGKGINIALEKLKITQMQHDALTKSKLINKKEQPANSEELDFYKQKNKQLEERVNSHIAVNNNLKTRLQYLLEDNTKYEELDKLKSRVLQLEKVQREHQQKITALLSENSHLKREHAALSETAAINQIYEAKIQQNERKLHKFTLENSSLQQQLLVATSEKENLEQKYLELQKQLILVTNQYMLLKTEKERLRQSKNQKEFLELKKKIDELFAEVNNKDFIINTLEIALKSKEGALREKDSSINSKESAIKEKDNALRVESQKLRYLSAQYEQLQESMGKIQFELQDTKTKLVQSQGIIGQLQGLKKTHSEVEGSVIIMNEKISQLEKQCTYYKNHSANLNSETCYYIELIRSNCLELEVLAKEIELQNKTMVFLADRIIQNSQRGLQSCQYLNEILAP